MAGFRLTPDARSNLMQIGLYTEQRWGRQQRMDYLKMIDDCFRMLADAPLQGKVRPEIHHRLRSYPVGRHIVFYLIRDEALIVIVNVLHARMDPVCHLPQELR